MDAVLVQQAEAKLREALGPSIPPSRLVWESITGGGSDRDFYRVRHPMGMSWIVMHYSPMREENALYVNIAHFLHEKGLHAPRLLFENPSLRLIGLEDLGDESLYSVSSGELGTPRCERLYHLALDQARALHRHASAPVKMMNGFDEELYRWERNYFLENLNGRWAGIELEPSRKQAIEMEGERMAAELMKVPRCLVHRDFQSQNLMVREESVWLIDFQGMRLGHAAYDVASLLYDPYVPMKPETRALLLKGYASGTEFEYSFYQAAVQRLMQALGAYGYLGLIKGKTHFLKHIPRGLENLTDALGHLEGMTQTREFVQQIRSMKAC